MWGSGVTSLNKSGNPYTVTAVTPTTFQFLTAGVANGTYTNSNNTCGPSANQDCLRISQLAYVGNLWWDATAFWFTSPWETGNIYKHNFDGGTLGLSGSLFNLPSYWAAAAVKSLVDPSDTAMRNVAEYCVNHIERVGGVTFLGNELTARAATPI